MYIKNNTLYSPYEFLKLYPNISFPNGIIDDAFAEQQGFSKVTYGEVPTIEEATQKVVLNETPTLINGSYVLEYSVIEKTAEEIEAYRKALVPNQITPRQARLALLNATLLDEVEALCSTNREMQIWFEYSLDFQRNHPMIEAMAVQLGLTQDDMDTFFIEASKL